MRVTFHFVVRYFERALGVDVSKYNLSKNIPPEMRDKVLACKMSNEYGIPFELISEMVVLAVSKKIKKTHRQKHYPLILQGREFILVVKDYGAITLIERESYDSQKKLT